MTGNRCTASGRCHNVAPCTRRPRTPEAGAVAASRQDRPRRDPRRRRRAVHHPRLRQHLDAPHRRRGRSAPGLALSPLRHQGRHPRRAAGGHRRRAAATGRRAARRRAAPATARLHALVVADVTQLCAQHLESRRAVPAARTARRPLRAVPAATAPNCATATDGSPPRSSPSATVPPTPTTCRSGSSSR